jgi:tripartite-type tricarboxylate transporter receptor subunit TctC
MHIIHKLTIASLCSFAMALPVQAQDPSNCTVRIVVSGPAGGTPDLIARVGAEKLSAGLGRPVVVENRAGGAAAITTVQAVKAAEPNGCTLMAANASLFSISPHAYKRPQFDAAADFVPVSVLATSPNVLVVNAATSAKTLNELVALLQAQPDKYSFGSGGLGTPMHLYGELIKTHAKVSFTHVPYRGSAAVTIGLLGKEVQFMFEQIPSFINHVQAGTLRALAVAGPTRSSLLEGVPTLTEAGVSGADAVSWFGLVAPRGTPKALVDRYSAIVREGVKTPQDIARLKVVGADTVGTTPEEMAAYMQHQFKAWEPLVKASGVQIE